MLAYCVIRSSLLYFFFFFNDTATTEIYTLSLHDALPISRFRIRDSGGAADLAVGRLARRVSRFGHGRGVCVRSEEHTSELQSRSDLVCRLLLEKKKKTYHFDDISHTFESTQCRTS